mgnify:CR=1 FL=1
MKRLPLLLLCLALPLAGIGAAAPPEIRRPSASPGLYYITAPPKEQPPVIRVTAPPVKPQPRAQSGYLATDLFGTTTSGGTNAVVGGILDHFENGQSAIRDSFAQTARGYERAYNASGKDKAFWRWKRAQDASSRAGRSASAIKWTGKAYSVYSIYRDVESYNKPSNHRHSSLAFIDQTMRGFSIIASSLDTVGVKIAKPLSIGGGIVKEVVGGETFAGWANQQDNFILYGLDTTTDWVNNLAYEAFLHYWFGIHNDTPNANLHGRPPYGVGVYKPNIYLYPESELDIAVTFRLPALLTATIPDYTGIWEVHATPDGTLSDAAGRTYGYLFYESETDPALFTYDRAWLVPAGDRELVFRKMLAAYGFNEIETADFVAFWTERLEPGTDFLMYPQTTEWVDAAMPLTVAPAPASRFRLWFAFESYTGGTLPAEPAPVAMDRNGYEMVEWGGFLLD